MLAKTQLTNGGVKQFGSVLKLILRFGATCIFLLSVNYHEGSLSHGLGYLGRLKENFLQRPMPDASLKIATYSFRPLEGLG